MQADANSMKPTVTENSAGAGTIDFDLEHFLPYRLSVLTNTISEGLARRYRDLQPLSVTEWRILAVLGRFPGLVASEVCDRTAMDKVAISRGVRSLMEKGMLDASTVDAWVEEYSEQIGPRLGAKVVAHAWSDDGYRQRLLASPLDAVNEVVTPGEGGAHLHGDEGGDVASLR